MRNREVVNSPVSCAGGPGSSPGSATVIKYAYAYRNKRTGLWWAGVDQEDTDDLRRAPLFPKQGTGHKLGASLWYVPVKVLLTIQEVPTGDRLGE